MAAQMGFLPGTIWLLVGVVLAGAVQDFLVLFISTRRDGTVHWVKWQSRSLVLLPVLWLCWAHLG
ncbi:carbon starvation CstA family protein [Acinetobacter baumannii]